MYTLAHLGPKERLAKLEKDQPWVFDLVPEEGHCQLPTAQCGNTEEVDEYKNAFTFQPLEFRTGKILRVNHFVPGWAP